MTFAEFSININPVLSWNTQISIAISLELTVRRQVKVDKYGENEKRWYATATIQ